MIVAGTLDDKAVLGNVGATTSFSINATAKSFAILSSSLYSNKIRAIVQELGANAKDSHKEAGKSDVPFEVHLPTQYEPYFHIRDFGIGLDHDQVMNLYTTYFASTKTDSNDYVGALGLGSKTPFSYTTNFSVTAIKNGRQGIYTAFIDDNGIPSIALMSETTTDECSGVTVSFGVINNADMRSFAEEVRSVYVHFKVKPVITGATNITISNVRYQQENIIPGIHLNCVNRSYAIMGEIGYPIDATQFSSNTAHSRLLNCGLTLEFNIGDLDIQANREGLSYVSLTKQSIESKLQELSDSFVDVLQEKISKIPNLWDQASFLMAQSKEPLWNPVVFAYLAKYPSPLYNNNLWQIRCSDQLVEQYNIQIESYHLRTGRMHAVRNEKRDFNNTGWEIDTCANNLFVEGDVKTGSIQRAKYAMKHIKRASHVFVMLPMFPQHAMDVDGFLAALHNPCMFIKASDVKIPTNKSSAVVPNKNVVWLDKVSYSRSNDERAVWVPCTTEFEQLGEDEACCYVELCKNAITTQHPFFQARNNEQLHNVILQCGITSIKETLIFGVRKPMLSAVKSSQNWIPLADYLSQCISDITEHEVTLLLNKKHSDNSIIKDNLDLKTRIVDPKSPFLGFVEIFSNAKIASGSIDQLRTLVEAFGTPEKIKQFTEWVANYEASISKMIKTYPMLEYVNRRYSYTHVPSDLRVEYINTIDEYNNLKSQRETET